jgi:signal transduction histidine kinase
MFTTKPFGQSTGLGLTIVHEIVVGEFGGTINVSTQVNKGAAFTIRFPRSPKTAN